jgi:colanic acid/amylovoran biosynthesis glycosyltransferase
MRTHTFPTPSVRGRIGYVVKRYPRFSETFIVNEILAHEADGLDVEIFALRPPVDTHFQNGISQVHAPVHYLPSGSVKSADFWNEFRQMSKQYPALWPALSKGNHASVDDTYQAMQLAKQIREKRIVHLHAHFATAAATVAQMAANIAGISYSVTMHAKDIFHESVDPTDLESKIADAKFVVTVSDFNQRYLSKFGYPEKIHRIYNGLDLDVFQFNQSAERDNKIVSVGRLVPKKGISHLIDACRILVDQNVEFTCDIIGTGELEHDLKNQIDRLSLGRHVKLIGPQPQNVVREMIGSSAVFAAPCVVGPDGNRDGLPTVITESLALGTPCVSTDVTGIPEIIRHQETGILVQQGNANELADKMFQLLSNRELCSSLAKNGRELVEREFDIHKNVARIRELFPASAGQPKIHQAAQLQGA